MAEATHVEEWTGENVSLADVEKALFTLREECAHETEGPDLRTTVATHIAWVPEEWHEAAWETLGGLAERHPSRTLIVVPDGGHADRLGAHVEIRAFPLPGERRHVASEVVELRLGRNRAEAPASILMPLLITGLPVFCRWRGRPPFGTRPFVELVGLTDRLVVDSREWDEPSSDYAELAALFDEVAVSDIAWRRTQPWRIALAGEWPEIGGCSELRVVGPEPDALLLAGWLRSRLGREVELAREPADEIEQVAFDGHPCPEPRAERLSASDLLSEELENFGRDRVYEAAVSAARRG